MRDLPKVEALFSKAEALSKEGDYQTSIEIYSGILTDWKDHAGVCERASAGLGEVYVNLRDLRLAEEYLKQAVGYNPLAPHYHYLLGFIYSVGCQWKSAMIEFEVAVKQEPENSEHLRGLGWVLCNCGKPSEGRAYLLRALVLAPDDVSILGNLAFAYADAREFDKALDYAQRATSIAPTNALVRAVYEVIAGIRHFAENTDR